MSVGLSQSPDCADSIRTLFILNFNWKYMLMSLSKFKMSTYQTSLNIVVCPFDLDFPPLHPSIYLICKSFEARILLILLG